MAPFAGAETGTGGRLRDVQATGRGAHTLAGIVQNIVWYQHVSFVTSSSTKISCSFDFHLLICFLLHKIPIPVGICGYCVGALNIPHHPLPWEIARGHNTNSSAAVSNTEPSTAAKAESTDQSAPVNAVSWNYPANLASPLNILIEASNGASDYGKIYIAVNV